MASPDVPPPPANPLLNPSPRTRVFARALPSVISSPTLGVRLGELTFERSGRLSGLVRSLGRVIVSRGDAGAVSGRRTASGGWTACTGRAPIGVIPLVSGPPALRLIIINGRSASSEFDRGASASAANATRCAAVEQTTIVLSPCGSLERETMTSVTASLIDDR